MGINEQNKTEDSPQEVLNKSVDPRFGILGVELLGYDAPNDSIRRVAVDENGQLENSTDKYAVRVAVDSVHNDWFYIGKAEPAADDTANVWQVKKMVKTTTDITITWADGNLLFDNSWDNREAISFS
jgi:hypothetical protein